MALSERRLEAVRIRNHASQQTSYLHFKKPPSEGIPPFEETSQAASGPSCPSLYLCRQDRLYLTKILQAEVSFAALVKAEQTIQTPQMTEKEIESYRKAESDRDLYIIHPSS